ncbi:MAG: hypothetical protein KJ622_10050 [Alphaproteobacteria bacterium]|nr:hypothetical protein [Alphaproteobacteria bacterium]
MDGAIWAILYDLGEEHRGDYLDWFDNVHIPEKLARPGYISAGHYAVISKDGTPRSVGDGDSSEGTAGYIAVFGGTDTAVFLNPSPAQIKPNQSELTRTMMGYRSNSNSIVAAREWSFEIRPGVAAGAAEAVLITCCDVPGQDEAYGAWCVQALRPALSEMQGFRSMSKYLPTVGQMKHVTLSGFSSGDQGFAALDIAIAPDWGERSPVVLEHFPGSPYVARRIWPAT